MKNKQIQSYSELFEVIKKYIKDDKELEKIENAYNYAKLKHKNQKRMSGEDYIIHPLNVAYEIASIKGTSEILIAALLHDVIEDCNVEDQEIINNFGQEIFNIVDGVTKIKEQSSINNKNIDKTLTKILSTSAKDLRVIVVKIADRIHNMATIEYIKDENKKIKKAKEVIEIYSKIADRLGLHTFKAKLDDYAFKVLEPEKYEEIKNYVALKISQRKEIINNLISEIKLILDAGGVKYKDIIGRPKNFYSIYKKTKENKDYDSIYDLFAFRIIVDNIDDCYKTIGIIHNQYRFVPGRFKDYISIPKDNNYQALHTNIRTNNNEILEIQVVTSKMEFTNNNGDASHWIYKIENNKDKNKNEFKKTSLEIFKSFGENQKNLINYAKNDLLGKQIRVFTPKGEAIYLPINSTAIDFAYRIHTEIAESMFQVRINKKYIVPISYKLQSDDLIEIFHDNEKRVKIDWLNKSNTAYAHQKIKNFFKNEEKDEIIKQGKNILEFIFQQNQINFEDLDDLLFETNIQDNFLSDSLEDMYFLVGSQQINPEQIFSEYVKIIGIKDLNKESLEKIYNIEGSGRPIHESNISIKGLKKSNVYLASCCDPVKNDDIKALFIKNIGYVVHLKSCDNLKKEKSENIINCSWKSNNQNEKLSLFEVDIIISADDRKDLLLDIINTVKNLDADIKSFDIKAIQKNAFANLKILIKDKQHLDKVIKQISYLNKVNSVERKK